MGAWGVLACDNDDACDWAHGLDEVKDFSLVESALSAVEEADDYLEAPDASNALAACEVIARASGRAGYQNSYTEVVDAWVRKHRVKPTPALIKRAHSAIQRVLGENSELRELWDDSDDAKKWLDAVEDLRKRVGG